VSNVRSKSLSVGQEPLWDEGVVETVRRPRPARAVMPDERTVTLTDDGFARRGWPSGTVLHWEPAARAGRGDLVVVRDGGRQLVGEFALELGRPALRTDTGSTWLAAGARVVGLVTVVEPPLAGL